MPTFNNAQISSFFNGSGTYRQAPNAATAAHVAAVGSFFNWMSRSNPDLYNKVIAKRPDLAQGTTVVASGAMGAKPPKTTGLKGMGDLYVPDVSAPIDPSLDAVAPAPATNWGSDLMATINQVLPTYFQAQVTQNAIDYQKQSQQALLTYNIQRAEQGLAPVVTLSTPAPMSTTTLLALGAVAYFALVHK